MRKRDREQTSQRILEAVGRILAAEGFRGIGVNAIAREAGVDKALIYRYFDDLDGLLAAFAESSLHSPDAGAIWRRACMEIQDPAAVPAAALLGYVRAIREDPLMREIFRWGLSERNALSDAIAARREEQGVDVFSLARERFSDPEFDLEAISSVALAGMIFLTLRSTTYPLFNGIEIGTDEGWQRVEAAVERIMRSAILDPGVERE